MSAWFGGEIGASTPATEDSAMMHSFPKRLLALGTVLVLVTPGMSWGAVQAGTENGVTGEPSPRLQLPDGRVSFRDDAAQDVDPRRVIALDAPLEPPRTTRSSRWKWIALGAGLAGAAAAYLVGGGSAVTVPLQAPGGTLSPIPIPALAPSGSIPLPMDIDSPSSTENGNTSSGTSGNGNSGNGKSGNGNSGNGNGGNGNRGNGSRGDD